MPPESAVTTRPSYRPDVDGLRAVAVLLVVAEHFGIWFSGGYIGVDVFFVISGYLISGIILAEMAQGRFSLVQFYERRVRRIFPALVVVLAAVTIMEYHLLVPSELESYAGSLLATIFSGSNFLFWHQESYFAEVNKTNPLLHTWSLAIEEQFYVLFPLFLLVIRRFFRGRFKGAILVLLLTSFCAAAITAEKNLETAFFFTPLRAWELLLGTAVSQKYFPVIRGVIARNIASVLGILLIVAPALLYYAGTKFPGLSALPPCLGAALIIAAGETGPSIVGWLLSLRPVVFIGLISYSVYLWHWPILVFERTSPLIKGNVDSLKWEIASIILSIVVGAVSWALIEQPFRKGRFRPGRRVLFVTAGVAASLLVVVAAGILIDRGVPARFPLEAQKVGEYAHYSFDPLFRTEVCFIYKGTFADFRQDVCLNQNPGRKSILLAGDSHAAQLYSGFAKVFSDYDVLQATAPGCRPFIEEPARRPLVCKQIFSFLFDDYLQHHQVDVVLLSGRWKASEMGSLTKTIEFAHAHNIPVAVIGPNMEYTVPLPRLLALAIRDGHPERVVRRESRQPRRLDAAMARLAQNRWHVPYVSVYRDLCTSQCPLYAAPGVPLLYDLDHLTAEGSVLLAKSIQARNELFTHPEDTSSHTRQTVGK